MRDRLKRRKKSKESAAAQPAPLQPAYFEAQGPESAPRAEESVSTPEQLAEAEPEPSPGAPSIEEASAATNVTRGESGVRRPRRRRGRGGRGRRRPVQAAAAPESTLAAPEIAAPVPTVPPVAASASASKGLVVLAIGLPGSGKSSWFKRHNITPLSSDVVRQMLFDDASEQRFQDLVFSNLRSMLRARLIARRPMNYLDATNLTPHDRQSWIKLAKDFGYDIQAVYFDVPLEVCLERNQKRQRVVTEDVMRRMAGKLKPPSFDEGFTKITVVRVKPKQD